MKIKLTLAGGIFTRSRDLVIDATKIETMIESDDGGAEITMQDGTRYEVKEKIAEIIKAYTPTPTPPPAT